MKILDNTLRQISQSNDLRMGVSYAKQTHALFFSRFCRKCNERIKDICSVEKGSSITKEETEEGVVPVVAGGKKAAYFHDQSNRSEGHITVSASGANSGFINYWRDPIWASDCITIKSKDETLYSTEYLYYLLRLIQRDIYLLQKGSDQPHVYANDINYIRIPDIPIEEQRTTLTKVSNIEEKIHETESLLRSEGSIIDNIMASSFAIDISQYRSFQFLNNEIVGLSSILDRNSNLRLSYRWNKGQEIQNYLISIVDCCKPLGKYLHDTQNGWSPECYDFPSDYQVLGIDSITKSGKISFDNVKYSDADKNNFDDYIVKDGDFFVSRGNTTDLVALASIAEVNEDDPVTIFPDLMIRLTLSDQINKKYLAYVINSFIGRLYFKYVTKGKNQTMVKVSPKELREFMLPVPSLKIQREIVEKIDEKIKQQRKVEEHICNLRAKIDNVIKKSIQ